MAKTFVRVVVLVCLLDNAGFYSVSVLQEIQIDRITDSDGINLVPAPFNKGDLG
jgi:hypothetical protein